MRANNTDGNQTEIITRFKKFGCSVLNISSLKKCCDIIVSKHGRSIFVEIKDGSKVPSARKLTEGEQLFKAQTQGIWRLVESVADADEVIKELSSVNAIVLRIEGR